MAFVFNATLDVKYTARNALSVGVYIYQQLQGTFPYAINMAIIRSGQFSMYLQYWLFIQ